MAAQRGAATAVATSAPPSTIGGDELCEDLRLDLATHRAVHDPGPAVAQQQAWCERVGRALARRQRVRVLRVEPEERASAVEGDAGLGIDEAGTEALVVGLEQAHRVAPLVGSGDVDGAATGGQGARLQRHRPVAVDTPGELVEMGLGEHLADLALCHRPKVGHVGVALRQPEPGGLQTEVDPLARRSSRGHRSRQRQAHRSVPACPASAEPPRRRCWEGGSARSRRGSRSPVGCPSRRCARRGRPHRWARLVSSK